MKKREEMQKAEEAKKEQEIERLKLRNAKEYYERGLIIKYVIIPLSQIVKQTHKKMQIATKHHLKSQKKQALTWFKQGILY